MAKLAAVPWFLPGGQICLSCFRSGHVCFWSIGLDRALFGQMALTGDVLRRRCWSMMITPVSGGLVADCDGHRKIFAGITLFRSGGFVRRRDSNGGQRLDVEDMVVQRRAAARIVEKRWRQHMFDFDGCAFEYPVSSSEVKTYV